MGTAIEGHFGASALTLTIQDGAEAGQTVHHVHVHILPRKKGDFEKNDEIYDAIDAAEADMGAAKSGEAEALDLDKERKPRTAEEMAEEAAVLRALFV